MDRKKSQVALRSLLSWGRKGGREGRGRGREGSDLI